jgi:hypothetical protein
MASLRASLTYNAKKRFGTVVDMYFCSTYSAATDASALNSLRTRKWAGLHAFQVSPASVGFSHRESVRTNLVPALPNPTYSVPHIPVTPLGETFCPPSVPAPSVAVEFCRNSQASCSRTGPAASRETSKLIDRGLFSRRVSLAPARAATHTCSCFCGFRTWSLFVCNVPEFPPQPSHPLCPSSSLSLALESSTVTPHSTLHTVV